MNKIKTKKETKIVAIESNDTIETKDIFLILYIFIITPISFNHILS